ncbi:MAG TPA: MarR family transcriptional regulator [Aeromicrobium sp.]|nr:MarR family transcriptional regulator [Aeromicrobium sp.]
MGGLDFDPIDEAARQWAGRWDAVASMRAVTSVMRAQQLLLARLDGVLRPHDLTFSRYEALVLLTFSRRGALPMGKIGERLQVHATSVSSLIQKLQTSGYVERVQHPSDRRAFLARITANGREVVERATADLTFAEFGMDALTEAERDGLFDVLRKLRQDAGDF